MKQLLLILICLGLMNSPCFSGENLEVTDQNDKDSYSLGYQYGETLKTQEWMINPEIFAKGLADAFSDRGPVLKKEEIQDSLLTIRKRMMVARQKKLQEQYRGNHEAGKAFLERNVTEEGIRILPSGLQYKILKDGSGGMPGANDTVTVHYRGTLLDGIEFDSSLTRGKPETFQVASVIPGWTEALQLMQEGSKWKLFVPSELAYGERGQGSRIPPYSTLIFELELLSIGNSSGPQTARTESQKVEDEMIVRGSVK